MKFYALFSGILCTIPLLASPLTTDPAANQVLQTLDKAYARIKRVELDNGLRLVVLPEPTAPTVAIRILVACGSTTEGQWLGGGLSHGLEHMVFKGTPTRPKEQFTRELAEAGGSINAYTSTDQTVFHLSLPSRHWKFGLEALSDAVFNCTLPADTWRTEQEVIVREMAMGKDDPGRCLYRAAMENLYTLHPRRVPVIGYESCFRAMDADTLRRYHRSHYIPGKTILAIAGAVDADEVESEVRRLMGGLPRGVPTVATEPFEPAIAVPRFRTVYKDGLAQGRVMRLWHTVPETHPDAPALELLSAWLSCGRKGRLVERIKERRSLATSIAGYCQFYADSGYFGLYASFDPSRRAELLEAIDLELAALMDDLPSEAELFRLRRQFIVSTLRQFDDMMSLCETVMDSEFCFGTPTAARDRLKALLAVTPEDVRRVARLYLKPNCFAQTLMLPPPAKASDKTASSPSKPLPVREEIDGVPVFLRSDSRLPKVTIHLRFKGGSLLESAHEAGILTVGASLATRGYEGVSREKLDECLESLGADFSASLEVDSLSLSLTALAPDVENLLPLLIGSFRSPTCAPEEFEKVKAEHLLNLETCRESPKWVAWDNCRRELFRCQRYRISLDGRLETVKPLTAEQVRSKLKETFRRGNCSIAVFGALPLDKARNIAKRLIEALPEGAPQLAPVATLDLTRAQNLTVTQDCSQAIIILGRNAPSFSGENRDAYKLLARMMSGLSSELFKKARIDRGLAYYIYAENRTCLCEGAFSIVCGTEPRHLDKVEALVDEELTRYATQGPTPEEVVRAKEPLLSSADALWQDNRDFAAVCTLVELMGTGFDRILRPKDFLEAVTPEQIKQAAADLLKAPRIRSVVLPRQAPSQKQNR